MKNSQEGLSGIKWIKLEQDENYGKLANLKSFHLTQPSIESRKTLKTSLPVVFTISSSSIHLPEDVLNKMKDKFFKNKNCSINSETRYFECDKMKTSDLDQQLNF